MTRLIDRIMDAGKPDEMQDAFWQCLPLTRLIQADNVAQYYFFVSDKDVFGPRDIPNVAPPFPSFFVEFRMPNRMNSGGIIVKTSPEWSDSEIGILFTASEFDEFENGSWENFSSALDDPWPNSGKWFVMGHVFVLMQKRLFFPCIFYMNIDEQGGCIRTIETPGCFAGQSVVMTSRGGWGEFFSRSLHDVILSPALLAVSFMHCKNVTMQRETPPAQLSKKYQKKHGRPLMSYHTLNIEPLKQILRTEGNVEKTGLKQALHICRGHFKDFSKGSGLFGKYKGLYWWDSQVRGSVKEGIVDKDYAIKSPEEPRQ